MSERIPLRIGPAPAPVARQWIANRQRFVEAFRSAPTISVNLDAIELLDMMLGLWAIEAESSDVFVWDQEIDRDVLLVLAKYWLDLGAVPHAEREALGVPASTPEAEAFTLLVVRGMTEALRAAGPRGHALLDRLANPE